MIETQIVLNLPVARAAVHFYDPDGTDHDGAKGTRWSWLVGAENPEAWVRRQLERWGAEGHARITAEIVLSGRVIRCAPELHS